MSPKNSLKKTIVKNAFYQEIYGLITKIGALIFTIVTARILFPELFGIYSLTLSIILTIATVSDLGIGTAMTRYVAESLGNKLKKQARSRFLFLLKFKVFSSLILSILLFFLAGVISSFLKKPDLVLPLQIGSLYLLIICLYGVISPIFLALQKVKYSTIAEIIFQISRVALIFIFLYFYKTVTVVFIVLIISLILALIYCLFVVFKKYKFIIKGSTQPVERRRLLFFSALLALSSINALIFGNIDRLMLGYFVSSEFIGYYTAIFTIVSGVLGLIAFGSVIFPAFVNLKSDQLIRAFKKTFNYLFFLALPATLGLAYISFPLLKILYGSAYAPVEYKFTIIITSCLLCFLVLEEVIASLYIMLFNAKEKPKWPALLMFISALLNIILNIILIKVLIKIKPEYGLIGAALATLISRYFNLIALIILCRKKFKISPDLKNILKTVFSGIIMLIYIFLFGHFISLNILTGILLIISSAILYSLFLFLFQAIKKEDIELIKHL